MSRLIGRKSARGRRGLLLAVLVLLVLVGAKVVPSALGLFNNDGFGTVEGAGPDGDLEELPDRITVLMIGVGSGTFQGPTDSIILASFDPKANEARLISIPRDTYAYIDGRGWDKINHAYSLAPKGQGAEATVKAVSDLLAVPVEYYAVVNMNGFKTMVDLLGGVEINVEKDMKYYDPYATPPTNIDLKAGLQRLDGKKALDYVRFRRDNEGDFGRMRRQQQMLSALLKEALQIKHVPKIRSMVAAVQENLDTNLGFSQMVQLALAGRNLSPENLSGITLSGTNRTIGGIYYLEVDLVEARTAAYELVYGRPPAESFLNKAKEDANRIRGIIQSEIERHRRLAEEAEKEQAEEDLDDDELLDGEGVEADAGPEADDGDADSETDADAGAGGDAGSDTDPDPEGGSDPDTEADSDANTDADSDSDPAGEDSEADSGTDSDPGEGPGDGPDLD